MSKKKKWVTVTNVHCEFCEELFNVCILYEKLISQRTVRCPKCGKYPRLSED